MFTQLHAMAQAATLLITAAADGDQLRISITPSYPDGKVPAGVAALRPMALVATPAELDADFGAVLAMWQAPKLSLIEQAKGQIDASDDEDEPKASGKVAAKAQDAKPKGKGTRKSAAAAAPQADTNAQPAGADAQPVEAKDDDAAESAAPDQAATQPAPAIVDSSDPATPSVDVHTLDLF